MLCLLAEEHVVFPKMDVPVSRHWVLLFNRCVLWLSLNKNTGKNYKRMIVSCLYVCVRENNARC